MTSRPSAADRTAVILSLPTTSVAAGTGTVSIPSPLSNASRADREEGPPPPYRRLWFRLTGAAPLLMHNGQMADPLNRFAREKKKIAGKRAKTDADHEELARIEFLGSLYFGDDGPCIPGEMIEAALVGAARKLRRGQQAQAGIISEPNHRLDYDGPRDQGGLWADEGFRLTVGVRQQRARIMRTRPIFRRWGATVLVDYLPDQLNEAEVVEMVRIAGSVIGIGDWRPKFGRFTAEVIR